MSFDLLNLDEDQGKTIGLDHKPAPFASEASMARLGANARGAEVIVIVPVRSTWRVVEKLRST